MIDVAMNGGDLIANGFGDISLEFTDDDDIIQMANSAINTIKSENIFHQEYGNDAWNKRLKIAESGFDVVEALSKEAMLAADDRIMEIVSIHAGKGNEYGECFIEYVILTHDGRSISSSTNINIL